ncbi:hypothetical protein ABZ949_02095 [Micromonospora tulbaghiae]|uniref:hypothetical protein n=1 Tax=Micromonospora tulbaghiae TaxID=479978 RepID=UPI0033DF7FDC
MTAATKCYSLIASRTRSLAVRADTFHEQMHWEAEAARFAQLAELERTDPRAARAAYRPTRAYDPNKPIVRQHGDRIRVITAVQGDQVFDTDKLATAWLLRMDCRSSESVAWMLRNEHGFDLDPFRYAVAADALVRAGIDPTKEEDRD